MGYEICITDRGMSLMGDLLKAASGPAETPLLQFHRVRFGEGVLPAGTNPEALEDLIDYVADGTATRPVVKAEYIGGKLDHVNVSFLVEYASHKNGADQIDRTFWLSEFDVTCLTLNANEEAEEFAFLRGDLVDCPMFITPFSQGAMDVRQFQVSIVITKEFQVRISFEPMAYMTYQDVEGYDKNVIQPWVGKDTDSRITTHNFDETAHPPIQRRIDSISNELAAIYGMFAGSGSAPFFWDSGVESGWTVEKGIIDPPNNCVKC